MRIWRSRYHSCLSCFGSVQQCWFCYIWHKTICCDQYALLLHFVNQRCWQHRLGWVSRHKIEETSLSITHTDGQLVSISNSRILLPTSTAIFETKRKSYVLVPQQSAISTRNVIPRLPREDNVRSNHPIYPLCHHDNFILLTFASNHEPIFHDHTASFRASKS